MQTAKYRHRIIIETASELSDTVGQMIKTWSTAATVWASVNAMSGKELISSQQLFAEATHKIELRFNSNVTPSARFNFGGRIFDINFVRNLQERDCYLECLCTEVL